MTIFDMNISKANLPKIRAKMGQNVYLLLLNIGKPSMFKHKPMFKSEFKLSKIIFRLVLMPLYLAF